MASLVVSAGTSLRMVRVARGLSQAQLADAVGCDQTIVSRLERDTRLRRSQQLKARIARVLGVSVAAIWGDACVTVAAEEGVAP